MTGQEEFFGHRQGGLKKKNRKKVTFFKKGLDKIKSLV